MDLCVRARERESVCVFLSNLRTLPGYADSNSSIIVD